MSYGYRAKFNTENAQRAEQLRDDEPEPTFADGGSTAPVVVNPEAIGDPEATPVVVLPATVADPRPEADQ